ncbi:MAG TPA: PadR family transcriptional regulator [Vicinamibacterales bacterium]|jgi:DNA-binding PadR family transcriptional regulator|nr:PadR family transcriptional regulator [Vicinamibacterales bacterium]
MADARRFLPLSPQQFHILLALVDQDAHGYGIIRDVSARTGGAVRLGTGTLYTAIARLEALGLVEPALPRRRPAGERPDERRRYYHLTALGGAVLREETARLESLVRLARRKGVQAPARPAWSKTP